LVCERDARDIEALFGFVKANQATSSVQKMCRLLRVSKSGFYAWDGRPMSAHERSDIALTEKIQANYLRSRETYGSPNIHAELADDHKIRVGRKRVARLMRIAGLRGATLRKFVITTVSDGGTQPADLVKRRFYAERPNRLWVADATYIPTWSGFLYLAIVLDVFSRKVVGWAMGNYLRTELMLAAINMAITMRRPRSVIHHSDHGNTPATPSADVVWKPTSCRRWARLAMHTITRWPKASSPRWSGKCSIANGSRARTKPSGESFRGWKVGIIQTAATHRWVIAHRLTTRVTRSPTTPHESSHLKQSADRRIEDTGVAVIPRSRRLGRHKSSARTLGLQKPRSF
jgi:hypothetical protein